MTATVGIDPRIQARRTAVRRNEGHRRLRRLQAVGAVLCAFAVAFAITRSPAMDVDHVRIQADGVDATTVREALGVRSGQPMTQVDPGAAADAVAALPTVESVEVRRSWPNSVVVEVTAREPGVVVASSGGGWLVADSAGGIVSTVDTVPAGLLPVGGLELAGGPGQVIPAEYRPVAAVGAALPADLRERAELVTLGEDDRVEVLLVDGGTVVFAVDGDHRAAAAAAAAVAATVAPGCVDRIDVVAPSAPVLRRSDAC
jgi:cell division protein FtsQ